MTDEQDEHMDLDVSPPDDDRQWMILYEEDYDNVMLDGENQVALLLDETQAREVFRLSVLALNNLTDGELDAEDLLHD